MNSEKNTTSASSTSNVIRLHIGPHIALKNAALSTQRRHLLQKINLLEQAKNGANTNKPSPSDQQQEVANTSNLTTTSSTNQHVEATNQQHYRYPSTFPYQQHTNNNNTSEGSNNNNNNNNTVGISCSVPPPPTQSMQGSQIGVFKPPTKHLRSVRPIQQTATQLLQVAQLAAQEDSPYNLQFITEHLRAPEKSREELELQTRRNQEREDEIKTLKERLLKLQIPKPHVFAATAKPFVSIGAISSLTSGNNANHNNNNNNHMPTATIQAANGAPSSTLTSLINNNNNIINHAGILNAKPFISSISVTSTRQMAFQMNAAANAAPFVPAFARGNSVGSASTSNNHNNNVPHHQYQQPQSPAAMSPGKMAGLANGGFGSSGSSSISTTSFATASTPTSSSSPSNAASPGVGSNLFTPTNHTNNDQGNDINNVSQSKKSVPNDGVVPASSSSENETKKSTPTTEEAKQESHRTSPDDSDKDAEQNQAKSENNKTTADDHDDSNSASYHDETSATHSFKSSQFTTTQNSPSKEQCSHNNNNNKNNNNVSIIPRFAKLTVTDFDAVFLKIAPLPRCHVPLSPSSSEQDETEQQQQTSSETKKPETPKKHQDDDQEKNSSSTCTYSVSEFMSHRHHLSSMSFESSRTLLTFVYADWEEHLHRALDGIKKQPSSPLLFSERNIPPIFVGRPEYHEMIMERVEYFKQRPEELKQHFEEKQRKMDQVHQQQQQQQQQDEESEQTQEKEGQNNNNNAATASSSSPKIQQPANEYVAAVTHLIDYTITFSSSSLASSRRKGENNENDGQGNNEIGRGGLFALPTRGRPQKLKSELHNKVLSILSRVTPEKYAALREELLNLPIRQATEEQLSKVVDVFFHKAVQEPKFCGVYADLVMSVFDVAQEERDALLLRQNSLQMLSPNTAGSTSNLPGGSSLFPISSTPIATAAATPTPQPSDSLTAFEARSAARTEQLAHRLRSALLQKCHAEFSREPKLRDKDLVDKETGKTLSREEQEEKWSALKKRLKGNVRFVGELYNRGAVTDVVVNACLSVLLMQIGALATERIPPYARGGACQCFNDHLVDVFVTLLETVGPKFRSKMPDRCHAMIETARKLSVTHRTPRTRILLLNLADAADGKGDKRWNSAAATASMSRLGSSVPSMMASRMGSVQDFSHHGHHNATTTKTAAAAAVTTTSTMPTVPPQPTQQQQQQQQQHPLASSSQLNLSSMQGSPVSPHPGAASLGHGFPSSGSFNNLAAPPPPTYGSKPARSPTPPQKGAANSIPLNSDVASPSSSSSALPPPPPPSYTAHISSQPSSPTNALPHSTSRQSLTGTPPHQQLNNNNNNVTSGLGSLLAPPPRPQFGERSSSSFHNMSSSSLDVHPSSPSSSDANINIFMASRAASPEKKNSLASLPSSSDLTADESVSLSEAFCRIEKCEGEDHEQDEGEQQQHESNNNANNKNNNNILSFIPLTKDISVRQQVFYKKLWQPAEKLVSLLLSSASPSSSSNSNNDNNNSSIVELVADFFSKQFLSTAEEQQESQNQKQTIIFSSGLGFLIAHLISSPNADGSGKRILDPALAKDGLILALQKSGLVDAVPTEKKNAAENDQDDEEEEDAQELLIEQVKILCMGGGLSAQEHQKRASSYFEAIGGGNEESEGFQAAQLLFRSWSNFVNKVISLK